MAGVSLMTVRRAMSELAAAGVIQKIQGKGTFLRSTRIQTESTIFGGLKKTLALQGVRLDTRLVRFGDRLADADDAARLSVPAGSALWEIVRVRHFDGRPAVREVATIPQILAPDLPERFRPATDSLYEVLSTHYGLAESSEEQTLIGRAATADEAADLVLPAGAFVIEVSGVSTSMGGTPFDSFTMAFVSGQFAFRLRSAPTADLIGA